MMCRANKRKKFKNSNFQITIFSSSHNHTKHRVHRVKQVSMAKSSFKRKTTRRTKSTKTRRGRSGGKAYVTKKVTYVKRATRGRRSYGKMPPRVAKTTSAGASWRGKGWKSYGYARNGNKNSIKFYIKAPTTLGFNMVGKRISLENQRPKNHKIDFDQQYPGSWSGRAGPLPMDNSAMETITGQTADAPVPPPPSEPAPVVPAETAPPAVEPMDQDGVDEVLQLMNQEEQPQQGTPPRKRNAAIMDQDVPAIGDADRTGWDVDEDGIESIDPERSGAIIVQPNTGQGQGGNATKPSHAIGTTTAPTSAKQVVNEELLYNKGNQQAVPGLFLDPSLKSQLGWANAPWPVVEGKWDALGGKWVLGGLWPLTGSGLTGKHVLVYEYSGNKPKLTQGIVESTFTYGAQGEKVGRNVQGPSRWAGFTAGIRERTQGHTVEGTVNSAVDVGSKVAHAIGEVESGGMSSVGSSGYHQLMDDPEQRGRKIQPALQITNSEEPLLIADAQAPPIQVPQPTSTNPNRPARDQNEQIYSAQQEMPPSTPIRQVRKDANQIPAVPKKRKRPQGADLKVDPRAAGPSNKTTASTSIVSGREKFPGAITVKMMQGKEKYPPKWMTHLGNLQHESKKRAAIFKNDSSERNLALMQEAETEYKREMAKVGGVKRKQYLSELAKLN